MNIDEEFKELLKYENKSDGTIETYLLNISCYMKWLRDTTGKEFKKLYRENIQDYISYLRTIKRTKQGLPLKAETINVHISSLIKFNKFLVKTEKQKDIVITEDDTIPVQKKGINPCRVTQEEIVKFRQDILECESRTLNNFETKRNFCMVTILQFCGLRISECISLEPSDINLETRELIVRKGKGGKQRTIYLNDKCISAIKSYLDVRPDNAGKYLFVTRESIGKDKKMDRTTVNKIFKKHSDKITPHQERHGWATHGLEANIYSLNEIQYLAGHSSISSSQIYLNPDVIKMREKANQQ